MICRVQAHTIFRSVPETISWSIRVNVRNRIHVRFYSPSSKSFYLSLFIFYIVGILGIPPEDVQSLLFFFSCLTVIVLLWLPLYLCRRGFYNASISNIGNTPRVILGSSSSILLAMILFVIFLSALKVVQLALFYTQFLKQLIKFMSGVDCEINCGNWSLPSSETQQLQNGQIIGKYIEKSMYEKIAYESLYKISMITVIEKA